MAALKQSLDQMQERKPPQRVAEAQAAGEVAVSDHPHAPRKRASARRSKPAA
jgi:hypothetical protein